MSLTDSHAIHEGHTVSRYARWIGIAMLLSIVFGILGEMYLPGKIIVAHDPTATAANILAHPLLFRLSFAAYLVEGICDLALCVFFYIMLRPVSRDLALLSAFSFEFRPVRRAPRVSHAMDRSTMGRWRR